MLVESRLASTGLGPLDQIRAKQPSWANIRLESSNIGSVRRNPRQFRPNSSDLVYPLRLIGGGGQSSTSDWMGSRGGRQDANWPLLTILLTPPAVSGLVYGSDPPTERTWRLGTPQNQLRRVAFGTMAVHILGMQADSCPNWAQHRLRNFAELGADIMVGFRRSPARCAQIGGNFRPILGQHRPISTNVSPLSTNVGKPCLGIDQHLPGIDHRPNSARHRPNLTPPHMTRIRPGTGQHWTEFGRSWPEFCESAPNMVKF